MHSLHSLQPNLTYAPVYASNDDKGICPEGSPKEDWKPEEDVVLVPIDPDQPNREVRISSHLSPNEKIEMTTFLHNNKDIFARSPSDMPDIDRQIICHLLHVNQTGKPVAQKRCNLSPERVVITLYVISQPGAEKVTPSTPKNGGKFQDNGMPITFEDVVHETLHLPSSSEQAIEPSSFIG